jgi:hypothetical protein
MVMFFLLVTVAVVFCSVRLALRVLGRPDGRGRAARPASADSGYRPVVPLDDAPPGVLDAIVAELRRPDHA